MKARVDGSRSRMYKGSDGTLTTRAARDRLLRALAAKRKRGKSNLNRSVYKNHIGAGTPTQSAGSTDDAVFDTDKY